MFSTGSLAIMFGAFAIGLAVAVIGRRFIKKGIPLYGNTSIPFLGITLDDRDKRLLVLAGIAFILCVVLLLASFL